MKKLTAMILAIGLIAGFVACGKDKNEEIPTEVETSTEAVIEDVTENADADVEVDADVVVKDEAEKEEEKGEDKVEKGEDKAEKGEVTLGNTLLAFFNEKAKEGMSAEEIAQNISQMPEILFACGAMPVEEGYLAGFDEEIKGFTSATTFAPMIGSIPFVGYVFETEDADALIATLKANANLRWNICVEAEEMVVGKSGNKVFFVMCPKSLEE